MFTGLKTRLRRDQKENWKIIDNGFRIVLPGVVFRDTITFNVLLCNDLKRDDAGKNRDEFL